MNILYRSYPHRSIGKSKKDELFLGNFCLLWQTAPILSHIVAGVKGFFEILYISLKHGSIEAMQDMIGANSGVIYQGIA